GTWSGSPTSYTYAWSSCDSSGAGCSAIAGANSASYGLTSADVGHTLRATVTAINAGGSTPATSAPSGVIVATQTGGVWFKPIDGGATYFASHSSASAWMDGTILLGAWMEQPVNATQVGYDFQMGENIYWNFGGTPGQ